VPLCRASWKVLLVVVLLGLAGPRLGAQDRTEVDRDLQRSYAIQAALADIDTNRANVVHDFLMSWTPYVDNQKYDLFEEVGPIAMRAPAWQLYGASLVGDFETMMKVLLGEVGAGRFINALSQPEARVAYDPAWEVIVEPDALGATQDSLVYTPIPPCRVVDTRGTGARTGIIPANGSRTFDLESEAFTSGQGVGGPCTGLPGFSHYGWAVNVTVTGYTAVGGLKAWGFGGTEPNASIINYAPGSGALANGLILTGCYGCVDDITVKAFSAATHVIIDVIGYFRSAEVSQAAVTRVAGTETPVNSGARQYVNGGPCPAGTRLIAGEASHGGFDVSLGEDEQANSTSWRYWVINNDSTARTVTVYSRCMDTPIKFP
jgi:hypothetical protein